MPLQRLPIGLAEGISGHPDALVVERHVGLAVVEVVLEAPADQEAAVRGDGDVALVVEAVDVGAEEEAVVLTVLASGGHRTDVGGVQDGEGLLSRHGAAALVVVGHQDAESSLAQPRTDEHRISIHRRLHHGRLRGRDRRRSRHPLEAEAHLVPELLPGRCLRVVSLPLDDVQREVRRGNPERFVEEEGGPEDDAADRIIRTDRGPAVLFDPPPHLLLSRGSVFLVEGFPDEAPGKGQEPDEEAAAGNVVLRRVQLEEQRLPRVEGLEVRSTARQPEVHLVDIGQAPKKAEPVVVGDGYEEAHDDLDRLLLISL